jgi:hypothetical protein
MKTMQAQRVMAGRLRVGDGFWWQTILAFDFPHGIA